MKILGFVLARYNESHEELQEVNFPRMYLKSHIMGRIKNYLDRYNSPSRICKIINRRKFEYKNELDALVDWMDNG